MNLEIPHLPPLGRAHPHVRARGRSQRGIIASAPCSKERPIAAKHKTVQKGKSRMNEDLQQQV